jgi:hypothetical protein
MPRKTSDARSGYLGQIVQDLQHWRQSGKVLSHFQTKPSVDNAFPIGVRNANLHFA